MAGISINTGKITIPISRDGERVGEISFNPSDAVFAQRYNNLVKEIEEKRKEMFGADVATDKPQAECTTSDEDGPELFIESCAFVKAQIDKVFGPGTSTILFGDALSFEMFNDFFAGIAPIFAEARAKKLRKYTE